MTYLFATSLTISCLQCWFSAQAVAFTALLQERIDMDGYRIIPCFYQPWAAQSLKWSQIPFACSTPWGGHIHKVWWHKTTTGSFTVSTSPTTWVTPSNLLLQCARRHQETPRVGTRLPWQQVTQRSCTEASAPSHEDPPHHPVSKNQGPNNFHLNAVIAVPSPRQASPRVTDSPNQVIRSSQTPTITRKLLGCLSNPQASVRPLTPTHFSF